LARKREIRSGRPGDRASREQRSRLGGGAAREDGCSHGLPRVPQRRTTTSAAPWLPLARNRRRPCNSP